MKQRVVMFRAYSPKWKKIIYDGQDGYTIDVHAHTAWFGSCDDECISLMQCTGIKDKNGKYIYEGDIIITGTGGTTTIVFGEYKDNNGDDSIGFFFEIVKDKQYECFASPYNSSFNYEVVGNIYI